MSDTKKNILVEKINKSETSISISNLAYEMLTPFGLGNDKFVYAATICWLREKLKADMIPTGGKYYALVTDATMEDFFQLVGTEIPVDKFATMDIRFPRVDPSGVYYDMHGNFIKTEGNENKWNSVYVKNNGDNSEYVASLKDFEIMTAALYGEGTENLDEMQAIGDVIMNRAEIKGTDMVTIITASGQVNGYKLSSQSKTVEGRNSNENSKLVMARQATLTTVLGISRGKSNGAYFWDGADIAITDKSDPCYNPHRNWGIHYTDPKHDIYGTGDTKGGPHLNYNKDINWKPTTLRGTTDHMLDSTAAFGGTIFWKKCEDYIYIMQEEVF